ncbi:MAG: hypothetical protein ACF8GE_03095 [Phycisphaerales bacterium JB043]
MLGSLRRHRSYLVTLSIALLSLVLVPGCIVVVGGRGHSDWWDEWDDEVQYDETLVERFSFELEPGRPVEINTEIGSVSVTRSDEVQSATVVARINSYSLERLHDTTVVASERTDATVIEAQWPNARRRHGESCDLEVVLPATSSLRVRTDAGAIEVIGFDSVVDVETEDGQITVRDVSGPVFATTHNGQIVVSQAPGSLAPVNLFSHRGSIRATLARSFEGALEIQTDRGSITLVNADDLSTPATIDTLSDDFVAMSVGTAPDESRIATRRGSITVKFHK